MNILKRVVRKVKRVVISIAIKIVPLEPALQKFNKEIKDILEATPSRIMGNYYHIEKVINIYNRSFDTSNKGIIVDIGAASGATLKIFATQFPDKEIYGFEPIKSNFKILEKLKDTYPNMHLVNKAVGDTCGELDIHKSKLLDSSSLLPINPSINNAYFKENIKHVDSEQVKLTTLDHEFEPIKNISILKIDVQGYELKVLKGGENLLQKVELIILEAQNHGLYENAPMYFDLDIYLREHGFTLHDIIPSIHQEGKLYEWDAIYINRNLQTGIDD